MRICSDRGVKPTPVIKAAGLASSSIARWQAGGSPNGETIVALSDCLNCSTDLLLRGHEYENDSYSVEEENIIRMLRILPDSAREFVYDSIKAAYEKEIARQKEAEDVSA